MSCATNCTTVNPHVLCNGVATCECSGLWVPEHSCTQNITKIYGHAYTVYAIFFGVQWILVGSLAARSLAADLAVWKGKKSGHTRALYKMFAELLLSSAALLRAAWILNWLRPAGTSCWDVGGNCDNALFTTCNDSGVLAGLMFVLLWHDATRTKSTRASKHTSLKSYQWVTLVSGGLLIIVEVILSILAHTLSMTTTMSLYAGAVYVLGLTIACCKLLVTLRQKVIESERLRQEASAARTTLWACAVMCCACTLYVLLLLLFAMIDKGTKYSSTIVYMLFRWIFGVCEACIFHVLLQLVHGRLRKALKKGKEASKRISRWGVVRVAARLSAARDVARAAHLSSGSDRDQKSLQPQACVDPTKSESSCDAVSTPDHHGISPVDEEDNDDEADDDIVTSASMVERHNMEEQTMVFTRKPSLQQYAARVIKDNRVAGSVADELEQNIESMSDDDLDAIAARLSGLGGAQSGHGDAQRGRVQSSDLLRIGSAVC